MRTDKLLVIKLFIVSIFVIGSFAKQQQKIDEKSCNQTARGRVVYFRSPWNARQSPICPLNIEPVNENVCQIRVDILEMNLASPVAVTRTDFSGVASTTVSCGVDKFYVTPSSTEAKLPQICGANSNTHFYIHLDQQTRYGGIGLNVLLSGFPGLASATWNIKITQLECPSREKKINFDKEKAKENPNQAADDFGILAPSGCLQYFTDPSGTVQSFGFTTSSAISSLTTNQDYSTCFKRYPGSCGLIIMPTSFMLRDAAPCPSEYLSIPEIPITSIQPNDRVCDVAVDTALQSTHPGPLYVHFHSESSSPMNTINGGFQYYYAQDFSC